LAKGKSLRDEYENVIKEYLDTEGSVTQVNIIINDIISLVGCTPAFVGNSKAWNDIVESAKKN
jgi:hypothetical protein